MLVIKSNWCTFATKGQNYSFKSKKLNKAQYNYFIYEREFYAIVYVLKKWQNYMYGAQFEIVFDHESIK